MTVEDLPFVLTVKEAAKVMRIDRNTLYEMIRQKQMPHFRAGRAIRIPRDALMEFLRQPQIGGENVCKPYMK